MESTWGMITPWLPVIHLSTLVYMTRMFSSPPQTLFWFMRQNFPKNSTWFMTKISALLNYSGKQMFWVKVYLTAFVHPVRTRIYISTHLIARGIFKCIHAKISLIPLPWMRKAKEINFWCPRQVGQVTVAILFSVWDPKDVWEYIQVSHTQRKDAHPKQITNSC